MQLTLSNIFKETRLGFQVGIQFLTLKVFTTDQKKHNHTKPKQEITLSIMMTLTLHGTIFVFLPTKGFELYSTVHLKEFINNKIENIISRNHTFH
jgi:hypothetical protein